MVDPLRPPYMGEDFCLSELEFQTRAEPVETYPLRPPYMGGDFGHTTELDFLKRAEPVETDPLRLPYRGGAWCAHKSY